MRTNIEQNTQVYLELDRKWKGACKILFGREVGELAEFKDYLNEYNRPLEEKKSSVSGKTVHFSSPAYYEGGSYQGFEEIDLNKKYAPLSINDIKDIDSIIGAVQDRIVYTGDIILGKSSFVQGCSNAIECNYVLGSSRVNFSDYMAYCFNCSFAEAMFGCQFFGPAQYCIRSTELPKCIRCFETFIASNSSDLYYCSGLDGCKEAMFTFNMRNKRHVIGNLELPKEKYMQVKAKLLDEIAQQLQSGKKAVSLPSIVNGIKARKRAVEKGAGARNGKQGNIAPINEAFSKTTRLLFGFALDDVRKYEKWLLEYTIELKKAKSMLSGIEFSYPPGHAKYDLFGEHRMIAVEERDYAGNRSRLGEAETEKLNLANAGALLENIAVICPDFAFGEVSNTLESCLNRDCQDIYKSALSYEAKKAGCNYLNRNSEYVFGCHEIRLSSFCINCYHCAKLGRCFECDSCRDCAGCFFCHNCENVRDSMFCFNVKNMKYAIGNTEVGREKFAEAKAALQKTILDEISGKKRLSFSIYDIGKRGR
ncbi:MAG: hypothetical protein WC506_00570 [Candidatus Micrarchaeia archaeon]